MLLYEKWWKLCIYFFIMFFVHDVFLFWGSEVSGGLTLQARLLFLSLHCLLFKDKDSGSDIRYKLKSCFFLFCQVYNTFLICATCEQETWRRSVTECRQTFFPAAMEFPIVPANKQTVITSSCYGAIMSLAFFETLQLSVTVNYALHLWMILANN